MASPPFLEVERLIAPIPGEKPAGTPPSFDLVRQLDEARREGDPFGPPRKQDWPAIVRLTTEALATSTKDMLVASRLTEGATQLKGFAGLRDSLTLLTRLLTDCWDRLHPFPEDGEGFDVRGGPLLWLNDVTRGSRFPYTITTVPLVDVRGDRFGHVDWRGPRRAELDTVLSSLTPQASEVVQKQIINANDDLAAAQAELQKLAKVVDERMPELGINLISGSGTLGTALADVAESVTELMDRFGLSKPAASGGDGAVQLGRGGGGHRRDGGHSEVGGSHEDRTIPPARHHCRRAAEARTAQPDPVPDQAHRQAGRLAVSTTDAGNDPGVRGPRPTRPVARDPAGRTIDRQKAFRHWETA